MFLVLELGTDAFFKAHYRTLMVSDEEAAAVRCRRVSPERMAEIMGELRNQSGILMLREPAGRC